MTDDRGPIVPTNGPRSEENGANSGGGKTLIIEGYHNYESDIRGLAELSRSNPALAQQLLDNEDAADRRSHGSHRLGLFTALLLVGILVYGVVEILTSFGIVASIAFILFMIALAAVIRVVLTGEWSDTSWMGKVILGILRAFGAKPSEKSSED